MPVVQTPQGEIIQDGTVILDHFEAGDLRKSSILPQNRTLRAISFLFELFGGEGLLRPAMHYRWNFDDDNLDFLRSSFKRCFPSGPDMRRKPSRLFCMAVAGCGRPLSHLA